jgi:hypothetical protein
LLLWLLNQQSIQKHADFSIPPRIMSQDQESTVTNYLSDFSAALSYSVLNYFNAGDMVNQRTGWLVTN